MPLDYQKGTLVIEFKSSVTPTLDQFKNTFGVGHDEVDDDYGVLPVDEPRRDAPTLRTYFAVVSTDAGNRIEAQKHADFIAVYSNGGGYQPPLS